jgi:hypothetical protein
MIVFSVDGVERESGWSSLASPSWYRPAPVPPRGATASPATHLVRRGDLPDCASPLANTLRAPDETLHAAKAAGRNRAMLAGPRPTPAALRLAAG